MKSKFLFIFLFCIITFSGFTQKKVGIFDILNFTTIPTVDHTGSGSLITLVSATAMNPGDVVYIASTGKATLCKADAIANCPYVAYINTKTVAQDGYSVYMRSGGTFRDDTWNWTAGLLVYVSTTGTSGNTLTQTPPAGANNVTVPIGIALTADVIDFWGNLNTIEHL